MICSDNVDFDIVRNISRIETNSCNLKATENLIYSFYNEQFKISFTFNHSYNHEIEVNHRFYGSKFHFAQLNIVVSIRNKLV